MRILGLTEEMTTCDRCGKTELKGTYAVEDDSGMIYYLGSTCVKKRYQMNTKQFNLKIKECAKQIKINAQEEYDATEEAKLEYPKDENGDNMWWCEEFSEIQKIKQAVAFEINKRYNVSVKY